MPYSSAGMRGMQLRIFIVGIGVVPHVNEKYKLVKQLCK